MTGKQCQCVVCNRIFSTERNYEKHRQGSYEEGRICLNPEDLDLVKKENGVWYGKPSSSYNITPHYAK